MTSEPASPVTPLLPQSAGPPPNPDLADRQLLERFARAGDQAAFAALVQRHGPMVLGVCRRLLRDAHEAEDAFQATFLVLVHKARSIGRPELLGPWLHGVAYRTAAQARQAARRRAREREAPAMPGGDPAAEVAWRELRRVLDEELGRLAPKYRVPLVLFYLEGKSTEEVARQIGCPKGTVQSRLARGRDRLRDRLLRRGVALSVWALVLILADKAAPAAVSAALVEGTVRAAALTAAGAAAGAIPATTAALTRGVFRVMFLSKLKVAALVLLALGAGGAVTAVCACRALADPQAAAGKGAGQEDEDKIQGTWVLVSAQKGGQDMVEEELKGRKLTFTGGKMTVKKGDREEKTATYKLDPTKMPKEIDTADGDKRLRGIYKLDGDTLTLCVDEGDERPAEFASPPGTPAELLVLKREKK
jgi:RNA polymerase sigma factor (sigma-70 family)